MWLLANPARDALYAVLSRVLTPYVSNLDLTKFEAGLWAGQFSVNNLRLKKSALDKFRLPIDVIEGHLGHLTLNIPWANLMSKPAEIIIEDLYLLAVPNGDSKYDPAEDDERAQAAKQERLKNADVLQSAGHDISPEESGKNQGVFESLVSKIVNNLQVTIKNIHVRYEDNLSVPDHPFAVGVTLAGFTATSTDGDWKPTFIQSTSGAIHKLATLNSLAVYFDTDAQSMVNEGEKELLSDFSTMISQDKKSLPPHQFILKPVSGQGRVTMNKSLSTTIPKIDANLLFDEIGFILDDQQYRDAISMADMYHFYLRQHQYRKFREEEDWVAVDEEDARKRARALLKFAGRAILSEIHEKNRRWTWPYFAKRRDDRKRYVELFKLKESGGTLSQESASELDALERKLSYEDIRFYRSIARSELRKERASRKRAEADEQRFQATSQPAQKKQGWLAWAWGSAPSTSSSEEQDSGEKGEDGMTDAQRKELYDAIEYDEKDDVITGMALQPDVLKARITAQLRTGSFSLRSSSPSPSAYASSESSEYRDLIKLVFDGLKASVIQRPENMEATLALDRMRIRDDTTQGTLYPEIIRMKDSEGSRSASHSASASTFDIPGSSVPPSPNASQGDPFFMVKFEHKPLDDRADNAITVKLKAIEVIYHRGYIEAIYQFLKPPESQLESVGALLNAANETFEGLRNQTRAGLEFALQTHKTVDIKVDMSAPIIIIPEDIRAEQCLHVVLDAGHISIGSDLADKKDTTRVVQMKRNQKYTDEDFERLEKLMYDRFTVSLTSTQLLMGDDLDLCLAALTSPSTASEHSLHIVERIDIDFAVQMSIVAEAVNLTRFKVSGKLPTLAVNISNVKYQGLMKMIDVAIPHFDDGSEDISTPSNDARPSAGRTKSVPSASARRPSTIEMLKGPSTSLFSRSGPNHEYIVDDDNTTAASDDEGGEDVFFEAEEDDTQLAKLRQRTFEFSFEVERLQASLFRTGADGVDKLLAEAHLDRFVLGFALAKYDMQVNVALRSVALDMIDTLGQGRLSLLTSDRPASDTDDSSNLVQIGYTRVQKTSPEFDSVYEGIDQSVNVRLSTFIFSASPEPVISLYDFIMTTFVPQQNQSTPQTPSIQSDAEQPADVSPPSPPTATGKIRVRIYLNSVRLLLIDGTTHIATLALSAANVTVMLQSNTLRVDLRLGNLSIRDESDLPVRFEAYKDILSIDGDNLADLTYETFDPSNKDTFTGINSSVSLRSGALKVHFLERPLHDIYQFLIKFARLKSLYDSATQAAAQRAAEIQRMKFDVAVESPIIIFPDAAAESRDRLVMRLGKISTRNSYEGDVSSITAGLAGICLTYEASHEGDIHSLNIVDAVDIGVDVTQNPVGEKTQAEGKPDTEIVVSMSDVNVSFTQRQYVALLLLSQSVPRVFSVEDVVASGDLTPTAYAPASDLSSESATPASVSTPSINLGPELQTPSTETAPSHRTTLDLAFSVKSVRLSLYDGNAIRDTDFKQTGIARFALNENVVRVKMLSNGALEAEIVLQSFTVTNIRPGSSRYREIIPAQKNRDQAQFMVLYTSAGTGSQQASLVVVTIDSPKFILAVDPIFALLSFFTSAFPAESPSEEESDDAEEIDDNQAVSEPVAKQVGNPLTFRVDLHDVSISVLENDEQANTQAIQLTIKQILISQQGILALTVNQLGMSLTTMGKPSETARFLDDLDLTLSLDNRQSHTRQMTSIELALQPIVFRASLIDLNLITSIALRAAARYSADVEANTKASKSKTSKRSTRPSTKPTRSGRKSRPSAAQLFSDRRVSNDRPHVQLSKEKLSARFEGFRLVLISNRYQLPILHLSVDPFDLAANDWSGELNASTAFGLNITYWNLLNSHWEPLIDPWSMAIKVANGNKGTSGLVANFISQERLDLNLTSTFIELALTTLDGWNNEKDRLLKSDRAGDAPYRIVNRTGADLAVWHDRDSGQSRPGLDQVSPLEHGRSIDWRFDDWKSMREHLSATRNNTIGIQFKGKPWEPLRTIPVDREGDFVYALRPRTEAVSDRLLCEVRVKNNVKVVTLRSTYLVENLTLYPLELVLMDKGSKPLQAVQKIAPGQDYAVPIDSVMNTQIRVRPDSGFGFGWSQSGLQWEDLIRTPIRTMTCHPKASPDEAPFRFQGAAQFDEHDPTIRKYPKITVQLRAPIELENLLPFDLNYRVFDKNTGQNWTSFLRQGGVMPIHSVLLNHLVLLNVEVQDAGLRPSEFAIINTDNADFDIEKSLTIVDKEGRKLDLRLSYIKYPKSGGAFRVQIYSPYILVNHTGLPLIVRSGSSKLAAYQTGRQDKLSTPTPFMFSHTQSRGTEFSFKIGDSSWSKVISMEAPSAETELVVDMPSTGQEVYAGLSWELGQGKYKLSKVLTIAPRFILRNRLSRTLCFREHGVPPQDKSTLDPSERAVLQVMKAREDKLLTVTYPGLNAKWSAPVNLLEVGTVHFRVFSPGDNDQPPDLIRAEIAIKNATIFVTFFEDDHWPFKIENDSDYPITFCQSDLQRQQQNETSKAPRSTVEPHSSINYAWDFPSALDKKIRLLSQDSYRDVDIHEIGVLPPFKFRTSRGSCTVSLDVRAEAGTQTLSITNYVEEYSLYKPKPRRQESLGRADTLTGTEAFETVQAETVTPNMTINFAFEGIGLSLVNRRMVELAYITASTIKFEYMDSEAAQTINLALGSIQIDNQLHDAQYPVVLQPTPVSKSDGAAADLPAVQTSLMVLKDDSHGVLFIKYASILLQALTISVDEDFLFALLDFSKVKGASWEEEVNDLLIRNPDTIPDPQPVAEGQELYFEVLELQPISLSLSFMRTERVNAEEKIVVRNPVAVLVNSLTMALGNVNDAPLKLNALGIKDARMTTPIILDRIAIHYRQEVLRQLYRILGSVDFIGNPVGLFNNVSSGIADVFYEPYKGVVMHGNSELGIGIAKGAASLVKKTVFGFSDSLTKVTSSIGKGLSSATFDAEYQRQRRLAQRQNKPKHAIYGVTAGAEALATSFQSGIEGVVMKPIEGAETGGVGGFFKGVGKGLVGAVAKPMVGVFDLASNLSEGIRNTTTVFDGPQRERVRIPRHIPYDGILTPYSQREALGQAWLKDLDGGHYRNELYVAHLEIPGRDNAIILTTSHVLSFFPTRLRLDWDMPFKRLQGVTIEDTGIRFSDKSGREYDRFIPVPKKSKMWFYKEIEKCVKDYNAKRRMER